MPHSAALAPRVVVCFEVRITILHEELLNRATGLTSAILDTNRSTAVDLLATEYLPVKNILVAIDSCEATNIASPIMERTLELASAFSSKVWILHIVPLSCQPPFNVDSKTLRKEVAAELHREHEFLQQLAAMSAG